MHRFASQKSTRPQTRTALVASAVIAAACGVVGPAASHVHAAAIPFSTSTFTLNHSTVEDQDQGDKPTITGGVLTLTAGKQSDANSVFYNTALPVSAPFTVSFVYQATAVTAGGTGNTVFGADGATFTIAAVSDGLSQIGGRGSGLGYGNNDSGNNRSNNFIANSAAVELTDYPVTGATSFNTGIVTSGAAGGAAGNFTQAGALLFSDPTLVNLTYNGTTLAETLTDQTTGGTFTLTPFAVNLATQTLGTTAYFGFTAGSGGDSSTQTISNFSVTPTGVPEPASIGLAAFAGMGLLARRRRGA